jgi:cell division protein FtsQ
VWYGAESPQLLVKRVTVSGNDLISTDEITDGLEVQGNNIFQTRRARMTRMIRALPAVQDADVQIRFPDHIHIVVRERTPVAIWDTGGRRMLVDADGVVLREGDAMLPIIVVHEAPIPEPGDRVDPDVVKIAQDIGPRLDALGLGDAQLDYRPSSGMTLISRGRRVALGFADHLDAKLDAYRTIRDHLAQTHTVAELVDVRFLDRPYFR